MFPCPSHQFSSFLVCGGYRILNRHVESKLFLCRAKVRTCELLLRQNNDTDIIFFPFRRRELNVTVQCKYFSSLHTLNSSCRASRWDLSNQQLWEVQPQHPRWPLTGPPGHPESLQTERLQLQNENTHTHADPPLCKRRKPQTRSLRILRIYPISNVVGLTTHVSLWDGGQLTDASPVMTWKTWVGHDEMLASGEQNAVWMWIPKCAHH